MKWMNCLHRVSVGRQRERYDKSHADYVQFVDDKKRQQLSYNDEQIHKYRRYDTTHTSSQVLDTGPHSATDRLAHTSSQATSTAGTIPHTRPHKY